MCLLKCSSFESNQTSNNNFDYGVQRDLNTSEDSNTQTLLHTKNILLSAGNIYVHLSFLLSLCKHIIVNSLTL